MISDSIDQTTISLFSSQYDKNKLLNAAYNYNKQQKPSSKIKKIFKSLKKLPFTLQDLEFTVDDIVVGGTSPHAKRHKLFLKHLDRFYKSRDERSHIESFRNAFGKNSECGEFYDEWSEIMFYEDQNSCDCCGGELNALHKKLLLRKYLCKGCQSAPDSENSKLSFVRNSSKYTTGLF